MAKRSLNMCIHYLRNHCYFPWSTLNPRESAYSWCQLLARLTACSTFTPFPGPASPPPPPPAGQCTRTACYAGGPALGVRSDRYRQDAPDAAGSGSSHLNRCRPVPSPAAPLGHTNRKGQGASCAHGTRACTRTPSLQGVARSFRDGMVTRRSRMFLESSSVAMTSWGRLLGFVMEFVKWCSGFFMSS